MSVTNYDERYGERNINAENSSWFLNKGQLIIDIKSTHLVKFEDYSLAYMRLKSNAKFYVDMDLIEKLMIQRHSFSHLNIGIFILKYYTIN